MKKSKSLNIIKMIQNGLNNFAKSIKLKPHLLYVILGLLAVIFISLGLGARRDGFTSMSDASRARIKAIDGMLDAINSLNWRSSEDKATFIKNVNLYYGQKMKFLTQGDATINAFDKGGPLNPINPDGQVYKLNPNYDISGNLEPRYQDNIASNNLNLKKYTLTQTVANPVKQTDLDAVSKTIMDHIKLFSAIEQTRLSDAFKALSKNADDMYLFITHSPSSMNPDKQTGNYPYIPLDQNNILSVASSALSGSGQASTSQASTSQASTSQASTSQASTSQASTSQASTSQSSTSQASTSQTSTSQGSGITKSNIQPGSEDLYVLKSQYPPPSNPPGSSYYNNDFNNDRNVNKDSNNDKNKNSMQNLGFGLGTSPDLDAYNKVNPSPTQNTCKPAAVPPCPPCERCPEPSFDCKRVPNYNSAAINQYLPQPVLADFSQFGM